MPFLLPDGVTPARGWVLENGANYEAIVRALRIILFDVSGGTLSKQYGNNFAGIVDALCDLGEALQGHLARTIVWPPATGTAASGSGPDQAAEGSLWFDARQGRLLVKQDQQWWQTNGAESMVHVGPTPPQDPISGHWLERMGQQWFCTTDAKTYIYVDEPFAMGERGWYQQHAETDFELALGP